MSRTDIDETQKENILAWWLDDIFKWIKNIDSTSLDKLDRAKRIIELEEKKGIPKTHLIIK